MCSETFLRLPEEKRTRFLDAAWEEFTKVPFTEASINKIVLRAKIPRGSFYQYFTDKKELFAYLIDRNGAGVTVAEIGVALWDNDEEQRNQNYIHQLFHDLRQTLEAVGMEDVFERTGYYYSVNPQKIECDYFDYVNHGKPEFLGEYMSQYSWAETTCGLLWKQKNNG